MFAANSGGAGKLAVPLVKALNSAVAFILMYGAVQRLVKLVKR
jgi:hypothetical protein